MAGVASRSCGLQGQAEVETRVCEEREQLSEGKSPRLGPVRLYVVYQSERTYGLWYGFMFFKHHVQNDAVVRTTPHKPHGQKANIYGGGDRDNRPPFAAFCELREMRDV